MRDQSGPLSRTLPHNANAEEGLLACCVLDPEVVDACQEAGLVPEAFYDPVRQLVYEAMVWCWSEKQAIDEILIAERLKSQGHLDEVGGLPFINQLTSRVDTTAHAKHFLEIVREKYYLRRLIRMSSVTIQKSYDQDGELDQFLEEVERELFALSEARVKKTEQHISGPVRESLDDYGRMLEKKESLDGLSTGYVDLDAMTYGLHPGEMTVLAARPSMGKTSLALNIAEAACLPRPGRTPAPTLVFSLEMSAKQLAMRMMAGRARVSLLRARDGIGSPEERQRAMKATGEIAAAPLWIDDTCGINVLELRAKARRLHKKHNLRLIIVDYLQLLAGTNSKVNREQQIAEISRGMKSMAKELNLPVIVLSQLNRDSEREKRPPRLSDLRESGTIEQDSDTVLMLAKPHDDAAVEKVNLIIAKQRNGPVGTISLTFNREITRFDNHR